MSLIKTFLEKMTVVFTIYNTDSKDKDKDKEKDEKTVKLEDIQKRILTLKDDREPANSNLFTGDKFLLAESIVDDPKFTEEADRMNNNSNTSLTFVADIVKSEINEGKGEGEGEEEA